MSFMNPLYLWALLGLLIPLAIHLWSKKEGKTIKIGSIKLLSEEDSKQSSSISLNELLLLLFRFLIVALVVLIMAEPQFKRDTKNTALTYIVEPSLINDVKIAPLLDSLKQDFPVLLLKQEFPKLDELTINDSSNYETENYWQLAKEMEALKTDSIIVFTNGFLKGIIGKRPTVNKPIDWIIVDIDRTQSKENLVQAVLKKDSIQFLSVISNPDNLSFNKEIQSVSSSKFQLSAAKDSIILNRNNKREKHLLHTERKLNVLLYSENFFENEAQYIESTLKTISKYLNVDIKIHKTKDSTAIKLAEYDRIIWFSKSNDIQTNQKILLFKIDDLATNMIIKGDTQNRSFITQPINPENILNKQFTQQFLRGLDFHPDLEKKIASFDTRIVSKAELLPVYKNESKTSNLYIKTWSLTKWLCAILVLLLIGERLIAYQRKQ